MRIRITSFWPGIIWLVVATIAFCLPGAALPRHDWFDSIQLDKWIHIGLFSVLIVLWSLPFLEKRFRVSTGNLVMVISMLSLSYGIVMEFIQHFFIPNRSFDSGDIAADAIGCLIGFLFVKRQQRMVTQ